MMPLDIDKEIVEKVLGGFTDDPDAWSETKDDRYYCYKEKQVIRGIAYEVERHMVTGRIWYDRQWTRFEPSESIADAWVVVEALLGRGHWVDICNNNKPAGWRVAFGEDMTGKAELIAQAICMAALAAVDARAKEMRPSP